MRKNRTAPAGLSEAERVESIERQITWNAQWAGVDAEGAAERARQLAKVKRPERFSPAPGRKP